jgi:hypothetical protein
MILRKSRLGASELDLSPISGAEALSLVFRLTKLSYSLAGHTAPSYSRTDIPCRFVPRRRE